MRKSNACAVVCSAVSTVRCRPSAARLADHRERALDVRGQAGPPWPVLAVGRERLLVSRRQLGGDALLDLVECRAPRRLLAYRLDHVVDVAPEGGEPLAPGHVAVAHDDV